LPAAGEIAAACEKGWQELANARHDMEKKGEETLEYFLPTLFTGCGDLSSGNLGEFLRQCIRHRSQISKGPELITSYDMAVLTEDSISHLAKPERPLIVSDQWMYHSRLYAAASYVKTVENLDLIQLNSFGCGLDAVTTDQVNDILSGSDKIYTCLKIDEVNNLQGTADEADIVRRTASATGLAHDNGGLVQVIFAGQQSFHDLSASSAVP